MRVAALLLAPFLTLICAGALPPAIEAQVDRIAREALAETGVPSASVAIVKDGRLAYAQAYGHARLQSQTPARPEMRYGIGSISKQFTATAVLLLAEQGKLKLDDPVSRFFPSLSRSSQITIRQLLSHTSGYRDYWPEDYVPTRMKQPATAEQILKDWAQLPPDFDPGTQWQYSNTGYMIAARIVEKASAMPFMQFLQQHLLEPLELKSAADLDRQPLGPDDPAGYQRFALGPLHQAPKEGAG